MSSLFSYNKDVTDRFAHTRAVTLQTPKKRIIRPAAGQLHTQKNMYDPLLVLECVSNVHCRHQLRNTLYGHQGPVYVISLRPDGQVILTGGTCPHRSRLHFTALNLS